MAINQKQIEYKVGLFMLVMIAAAVAAFVYIGIQEDFFASRTHFFVLSKTGEKLERGIPVKLSGFKIGQVTSLYLDNIDYVKIKIEVLERYHKWFRTDTTIILDQEGIIGNAYLKLIPGTDNATVLKEGDTIEMHKIGGLNELLEQAQPVVKDATEVVANIRKITERLADDDGPVARTMDNLAEMSDRLNSKDGLIYYLGQDKRPVAKMDEILSRTDELLASVDALVNNSTSRIQDLEPLQKELTATLQEGKEFVSDLRRMRAELDPTIQNINAISSEVKEASRNLKSLRVEGEYTLRLGSELLLRLKQTWPFATGGDRKPPVSYPLP